jgi:hypothetical protein
MEFLTVVVKSAMVSEQWRRIQHTNAASMTNAPEILTLAVSGVQRRGAAYVLGWSVVSRGLGGFLDQL